MTSTAIVTLGSVHRDNHLRNQHRAVELFFPGIRHVFASCHQHGGDESGWRPWEGAAGPMLRFETSLPLALARNQLGDYAVNRGYDTVIFLDADVLPGPALVNYYQAALDAHPGSIAAGPVTYLPPTPNCGYPLRSLEIFTNPHPARPNLPRGTVMAATPEQYRLFWSLSFAVSAETWRHIRTTFGGFCEEYVGYGAEDTDFGANLEREKIPLVWTGGAHGYHQHHPVSSPPIEHLEDIVRNGQTFARRWGYWPMEGWLRAFAERGLVQMSPEGNWHLIEREPTHRSMQWAPDSLTT